MTYDDWKCTEPVCSGCLSQGCQCGEPDDEPELCPFCYAPAGWPCADDCIDALTRWYWEDAPYVCPGCHSIGGEPCAPWCPDWAIEMQRRDEADREDEADPDDEAYLMGGEL